MLILVEGPNAPVIWTALISAVGGTVGSYFFCRWLYGWARS
jgi:hypothetical protein